MLPPRVFHPDGLPQPQRTLAFLAVMATVTMAVLDGSIVNVALPSLAKDLAVSPAQAIGVVTAYQIAIVASLLPLSALAEAIGFRKVYLSGVVLFAGASFLCAEARSLEVLILARVAQGLGAASIMSINSAVVRHIMPRDRLGWGISWIAMTVAVAAAAGPTIAAGILSVATWHWLFLVNVPVSALALALGVASLPHTERSGVRFDVKSALLNVLAFGFLLSALDGISAGATSALIVIQLAVALTSGVLLVLRQAPRISPMLPVDLLQRPPFALALLASILAFTGQFVAAVSLPFYFHDTLGYGAVHTGLMLTAWPLATGLAAPIAGRWVDRTSARPLTTVGMAVFGAGLILITVAPVGGGPLPILAALALTGVGFGLFQSPNNHTILTTAPRERSGAASGLQSTARQLGQSLGAALAALLIGTGDHFDVRPTLWTAAGFAIVATAICAVRRVDWQNFDSGAPRQRETNRRRPAWRGLHRQRLGWQRHPLQRLESRALDGWALDGWAPDGQRLHDANYENSRPENSRHENNRHENNRHENSRPENSRHELNRHEKSQRETRRREHSRGKPLGDRRHIAPRPVVLNPLPRCRK